ncbi:MAG: SDR family oxidoreductase [Chitinophagaceae bacterium]
MSYALVTGAAKGIGKGIARELARRKYNLLLVDLDNTSLINTKTFLESTFDIEVQALHLDLSTPDAPERLLSWSAPWHHNLAIVINNAGYGLNGSFEQLSLAEQLNLIDVNIKAQVILSHAYIPVLKKQTQAYLLNVGSTTAYQSIPYFNIYAASKAFVISFTRSLRYELLGSPVSVSVLIPGSTDTDFVNRARLNEKARKKAEKFDMQPDDVGQIAVRGLLNKKAEIIPGFTNKLHAFLPKFFPKILVEKIAADIYRPEEVDYALSDERLLTVSATEIDRFNQEKFSAH